MTVPAPGPGPALPDELRRLADDAYPQARAVAAAVTATALDDLEPGERGWVTAVESLRAALDGSHEPISIALPNARGIEKHAPLGEVCRLRSKKPRWALFLLVLTRRLRPERVLELGTCLGISASYLAAGLDLNGMGRLVTLEGAGALADRSGRNLRALGLRNTEVVPGLFRHTLPGVLDRHHPVDLAFVDGHHDEHATLEYFDLVVPALADHAVVVFDDIRWSDGMARAWEAVQGHPRVHVAVDLDRVGVCVAGLPGPAARRYRLPTVTTLHSTARRRGPGRPGGVGAGERPVPG